MGSLHFWCPGRRRSIGRGLVGFAQKLALGRQFERVIRPVGVNRRNYLGRCRIFGLAQFFDLCFVPDRREADLVRSAGIVSLEALGVCHDLVGAHRRDLSNRCPLHRLWSVGLGLFWPFQRIAGLARVDSSLSGTTYVIAYAFNRRNRRLVGGLFWLTG